MSFRVPCTELASRPPRNRGGRAEAGRQGRLRPSSGGGSSRDSGTKYMASASIRPFTRDTRTSNWSGLRLAHSGGTYDRSDRGRARVGLRQRVTVYRGGENPRREAVDVVDDLLLTDLLGPLDRELLVGERNERVHQECLATLDLGDPCIQRRASNRPPVDHDNLVLHLCLFQGHHLAKQPFDHREREIDLELASKSSCSVGPDTSLWPPTSRQCKTNGR